MTGIEWMSKPRIWTGHFWLADDPDHQVPGILNWSPDDGVSVSLIGGFVDHLVENRGRGKQTISAREDDWPVVYGFADNVAVTLIDAYPAHTDSYGFFHHGPPAKQTLRAASLLVGMYVESPAQAKFRTSSIDIENLSAFASNSGLKMSLTEDGKSGPSSVESSPVEDITISLNEMTARLIRRRFHPVFRHERTATVGEVREASVIRFEFDSPQPLTLCRDVARAVQDLLSLAVGEPCGILSIAIEPASSNDDEAKKPRGTKRLVQLYESQLVKCAPEAAPLRPTNVRFTAEDFPFDKLLPRWFELRERFRSTCNMMLGLAYISDGYLETELLTVVGAAESMHRALELPPPMPTSEFNKLKKSLIAAVPKNRRELFREKIRNEPTLRERLLHLASRLDPAVSAAILPNVEAWATAAKNSRNVLAHTGGSHEEAFDELHAVVEVTKAVVVTNLLTELGLSSEFLLEAAERNKDLRIAAQLANRRWPISSKV